MIAKIWDGKQQGVCTCVCIHLCICVCVCEYNHFMCVFLSGSICLGTCFYTLSLSLTHRLAPSILQHIDCLWLCVSMELLPPLFSCAPYRVTGGCQMGGEITCLRCIEA